MSTLQLKNIKKSYGKTAVVHGIDLEISENEFIVLVGPSGCGKSTTLRMIAGLEEITDGELFIAGDLVNYAPPHDRKVAMVFQNYALYPHMDVYENMAFGLRIRKLPVAEIDEKVKTAAETLGLTDYLKRRPKELSGGQRQRVAMGRAMVKNAEVFLFDEPLSNLDAKLRMEMRTEIKRRHLQHKKTTIYVTHDQIEAMTLADRLVIMNDGIIEQIGSPLQVFSNPVNKFVASFIGSPGMNFFNLNVVKDGDKIVLQDQSKELTLPVPKEKQDAVKNHEKVILGVRPSDIFLSDPSDGIPDEWKLKGTVVVFEFLGKNAYLELKVGDNAFTGEVNGTTEVEHGQSVDISFNLHHMHLFDPKTEMALT